MNRIQVLDKEFELFISSEKIQERVQQLAHQINTDLKDQDVVFIGVLNGAFMFVSDLFRHISFSSRITFLKLASYSGTGTSGKIKHLIGLNENIKDKVVVVLEDIVDTGHTMEDIIKQLRGYEPAEIRFATMFFKPSIYQKEYRIDYIGLEVENDFIIGYGLDYNGYGRNYQDVYKAIQ